MTDRTVRVSFSPDGREVFVLPGASVLEAAACAGLAIDTPCGGVARCGRCRVQMKQGAWPPTEAEREAFQEDELAAGWRLACQTAIRGESAIHIPSTSLFAGVDQVQTVSSTERSGRIRPAVRKIYVAPPEPTRSDPVADLERLERAAEPFRADLALIQRLPALLRENAFRGSLVLCGDRLIDFEPGDTTSRCYGAAFDVGTTTLAGALIDLNSGREAAVVSSPNPQAAFGDDVLSRIRTADSAPDGLARLREAVLGELGRMVQRMAEQAGVPRQQIYATVLAGNTTMEHLLCGINPRPLGQAPFTPAHARGLTLSAHELAIPIHDRADAYLFPVVGGYVGGDTVAGMLAAQLDRRDGPTLMVDVGTNGEIVLAKEGELWAASAAAGPAFEGARISCGMRAARGAIEKVAMAEDVQYGVIGQGPPRGLCGSGLIDLAAELLRRRMISPDGRMMTPDQAPQSLPEPLKQRLDYDRQGRVRFLIARSENDDDGADSPIVLTQRDVRELQLASGAIRTGVILLLQHAGLQAGDLESVLLAGGFGSFLRRRNALRIGLLPSGIDRKRIHYVGNTSLAGAKWALLSQPARAKAEELAKKTRLVELSLDPDFTNLFADAMIFPDGDSE